ncbi:bleomycin hydrolase, partial [Oleoguttula sp. CCFEE 5521]
MGAAQSVERPVRRVAIEPPPYTTLDEKFDAVRISHGKPSSITRGVLSSRDLSTVSATRVQEYIVDILKDPKNQLSLAALSKNNINAVLERPSTIVADRQVFNVSIPQEIAPVTNQRASGRCWIFAATNVFRIALSKKYKLEKFELSQAYLFFWDKVEKANYFLEATLLTADQDIDSRLVSTLSSSPVGDGGQWDMLVNLVAKYGLVPQSLYPDSFNAKASRPMDS